MPPCGGDGLEASTAQRARRPRNDPRKVATTAMLPTTAEALVLGQPPRSFEQRPADSPILAQQLAAMRALRVRRGRRGVAINSNPVRGGKSNGEELLP